MTKLASLLMGFIKWGVFTIVIAAFVHIAVVLSLPSLAMSKLSNVLEKRSPINTIQHAARPDETSRLVVKPSPDLIYSICLYDVSLGPLRLTSPVPDSYWSLSAFADDTENFLVINDKQVGTDLVDLLLIAPGSSIDNPENLPIIAAKTLTGVILTRSLITSESALSALDALRQEATCAPYRAAPDAEPSEAGDVQ